MQLFLVSLFQNKTAKTILVHHSYIQNSLRSSQKRATEGTHALLKFNKSQSKTNLQSYGRWDCIQYVFVIIFGSKVYSVQAKMQIRIALLQK